MSLDRVFIHQYYVLMFSFDPKAKKEEGKFPMPGYSIIIPRERALDMSRNSSLTSSSNLTFSKQFLK